MRPVPVVFLRLAFSDQLSVLPRCQYPNLILVLPSLVSPFHGWVSVLARVCVCSGSRTLSGLSSGEAARSAGVLLDVQRSATCLLTKWQSAPLSSCLPCNCSCPICGSLLFQLLHRMSGGWMLLTTSTAQSVRLVVALSERAGSLRCLNLSVSLSSGWVEIVGQGGRTHFVGLSGAKIVSTKWCQSKKSRSESDGVLTYHC